MTTFVTLIETISDRDQRRNAALAAAPLDSTNKAATSFREGACLDKTQPLNLPMLSFRTERGPNARDYFASKWRRYGSLGEHQTLNPFLESFRKEDRNGTRH